VLFAGPEDHQAPEHKGLFPLPAMHAAAIDHCQVRPMGLPAGAASWYCHDLCVDGSTSSSSKHCSCWQGHPACSTHHLAHNLEARPTPFTTRPCLQTNHCQSSSIYSSLQDTIRPYPLHLSAVPSHIPLTLHLWMHPSPCLFRELIHWRGEPDPFKGDVPNARVREFAKEVVEVMFNSAPVQPSNNTLAAQVRVRGLSWDCRGHLA
jgi:hypothetical protein